MVIYIMVIERATGTVGKPRAHLGKKKIKTATALEYLHFLLILSYWYFITLLFNSGFLCATTGILWGIVKKWKTSQ